MISDEVKSEDVQTKGIRKACRRTGLSPTGGNEAAQD